MRGRPPKPSKAEEPFRLQPGDQFRFGPGTLIRVNGDGAQGADPGDQEFVVVGTAMTGGGIGHGDVYPDGYEVRAVPLGTALQAIGTEMVRFYQSGAFASNITPPPVILTVRAVPEVAQKWAGTA